MTESELALREQHELAVAEAFGGVGQTQLPTDAAIPAIEILRESQQFRMPDGRKVDSFDGHVLYWHEANAYWATKFGEGETTMPDCSSSDGSEPDSDEADGRLHQSDRCVGCPQNQYGTAIDGGDGKACQNMIRMYIILDGHRIPYVLKAPPSSLGKKDPFKTWLTMAVDEGVSGKYQTVNVNFSLFEKSFSKFKASALCPRTNKVLDLNDPDDKKTFNGLACMYLNVLKYHEKRVQDDMAAVGREGVTNDEFLEADILESDDTPI
jgi:hypothetical protein